LLLSTTLYAGVSFDNAMALRRSQADEDIVAHRKILVRMGVHAQRMCSDADPIICMAAHSEFSNDLASELIDAAVKRKPGERNVFRTDRNSHGPETSPFFAQIIRRYAQTYVQFREDLDETGESRISPDFSAEEVGLTDERGYTQHLKKGVSSYLKGTSISVASCSFVNGMAMYLKLTASAIARSRPSIRSGKTFFFG
jgi:hypothetical protein